MSGNYRQTTSTEAPTIMEAGPKRVQLALRKIPFESILGDTAFICLDSEAIGRCTGLDTVFEVAPNKG
jgi:hypothetical protein